MKFFSSKNKNAPNSLKSKINLSFFLLHFLRSPKQSAVGGWVLKITRFFLSPSLRWAENYVILRLRASQTIEKLAVHADCGHLMAHKFLINNSYCAKLCVFIFYLAKDFAPLCNMVLGRYPAFYRRLQTSSSKVVRMMVETRDGHADAGICSSCGLCAYAQICGCGWKSHPHLIHI